MARAGTLTEARARELVGEVLQRTSGEPLSYFTAEQWFRHWVEAKKSAKADKTGERYEQIVDEFVAALNGRAKLNISALTPKDILDFRNRRVGKGLAPSTVNLDITILKGGFNAAKKQGYISANPCDSLDPVPDDVAKEQSEKATFAPEHIRMLIKAAVSVDSTGKRVFKAGEQWRGLILVGYYVGARLQDGANLRWESVDLPARLIKYTARKTRERVVVPIHPELESYFLSLSAPDRDKAFVFPKLAGRGTSGLSRTFGRIMARAKISGRIARERRKHGRTVRTLTFHSLRHSFNSAMANAGVSQEVRQKLTGHTSAEMNKVYTHHEVEPLREAIGRIPAVGGP